MTAIWCAGLIPVPRDFRGIDAMAAHPRHMSGMAHHRDAVAGASGYAGEILFWDRAPGIYRVADRASIDRRDAFPRYGFDVDGHDMYGPGVAGSRVGSGNNEPGTTTSRR